MLEGAGTSAHESRALKVQGNERCWRHEEVGLSCERSRTQRARSMLVARTSISVCASLHPARGTIARRAPFMGWRDVGHSYYPLFSLFVVSLSLACCYLVVMYLASYPSRSCYPALHARGSAPSLSPFGYFVSDAFSYDVLLPRAFVFVSRLNVFIGDERQLYVQSRSLEFRGRNVAENARLACQHPYCPSRRSRTLRPQTHTDRAAFFSSHCSPLPLLGVCCSQARARGLRSESVPPTGRARSVDKVRFPPYHVHWQRICAPRKRKHPWIHAHRSHRPSSERSRGLQLIPHNVKQLRHGLSPRLSRVEAGHCTPTDPRARPQCARPARMVQPPGLVRPSRKKGRYRLARYVALRMGR